MLPILMGFMVDAKKWKVAGAEPWNDCGALPRWPNLFLAQGKWAGGAAVPPSPADPRFNLPGKYRNLFSGRRCRQGGHSPHQLGTGVYGKPSVKPGAQRDFTA
ncbi:MAG: hypothetical protein O7A67_04595, partial [SAR324 cluster bacterium]|nr:hypothetical protein [SAR324 cluster bacterium]